MVEEAHQAESRADFIHKLSVANKEANKTHYWSILIKDTELSDDTASPQNECEELIKNY